jgi:predicted ATPase/DNA-binding NarL/FixJ family response regulator
MVLGMGAESVTRPVRKLATLTHARTSFIGRTDAVEKVAGLLARYRLVTVTGPGGVGKTRLADEVLKQVAGRFADGVGIVELAAVSEPALVAAAVATALEVRQAAGMSILDALADRLSRQQLLLVLDNCEHVLDAVAELCAALLVSADDITILATSREPLGLPEEARYRLPPLALRRQHTEVQAEATTLFVERARQLNADFAVDGDSDAIVARLVQRLDGMPLAIELAAARVEALGLTQLLERLDDRFRLLVSVNRAAAARQRSLEATVDWSYQLLDAPEQRAFRRLAVFPGPFTLEAAEAVAGADAGPVVLHLVDCSLLVPPATGPDGRSRYLMLETLRGYGLARLHEAGEEQEAAAALTAHSLHVAEQAAAQMAVRSSERSATLWLDAEDAAVHQGLAWALDHDPSAALRLAVALAPWWWLRGRWIQGGGLLRRAVEQTSPAVGPWYAAHLWLGHLARGTLDGDSALRHYSAVVQALTDKPTSQDLVDGLLGRCAVLRNTTSLEQASADASTALTLARQIGYATGEAMALAEFSIIASYANDGEQAVAWAIQVQQIDRDRMAGWFSRQLGGILPWVMVRSEHLDGVLDICAQALEQARAMGDVSEQADMLVTMAELAWKTGRPADAGANLREAIELAMQAGYRLCLITAVMEVARLCAAAGQYADAITLWGAGDAQARSAGLTDNPYGEISRKAHQEATQMLGAEQVGAAQTRGVAMTLVAAAEFAIMTIDETAAARPTKPLALGKLSAREHELITLVAQGKTDAQIAEKLFISVSTVRTHLDRIRDKSGCRRRADLTRLALQEGIV